MKTYLSIKNLVLGGILSLTWFPMMAQESQLHLYLSGGGGSMSHTYTDSQFGNVQNQAGVGLQAGVSYSFFLADQIGIGAGLEFGLQRGALAFSDGSLSFTHNDDNGYTLTNLSTGTTTPNPDFTLNSKDDISQNYTANTIGLTIPVYYRISTLGNGGDVFLNLGPKVSFFLGDGQGWDGTGTSTFEGDFTINDNFSVILDDIDQWGFRNETLTENNGDALFDGIAISFFIAPGITIPIGENRAVSLGLIYQGTLNNISANTGNVFASRREQTGSFSPNLSSAASRIGGAYGGFFAGIMLGKSGNSKPPKPPKPDPDKPDPDRVEAVALNTVFSQSRNTRRNAERNDPEFDKIMESEAQNLRYKNTLDAGEISREGKITYNGADPDGARKINPNFNGRNRYLKYEDHTIRDGNILLEITPLKNTIQQKLTLLPVDEEGNPINGFNATLKFGGQTWHDKKMNSGDLIPDLYQHPAIAYELTLTHPCYTTITQTVGSQLNYEAGLRVPMAPSGQMVRLQVPISGLSSLNREQAIGGVLNIRNERSEVTGNQIGNQLILNGGCGLEVSGRSALTLQKPKGFDIKVAGQAGDWKDSEITLPMQDKISLQSVEVVALPVYHLLYVDISSTDNRGAVIDQLESMIQEIGDNNGEILGFLSNSNSPRVITSPGDMDKLLQGVAQDNPDVPNPQGDLIKIRQRLDPEVVIPSRKQIVLNFVLSDIIYERSREIIIKDLIEGLGDETEDIIVRIFTEKEIPESNRMRLNLQTEIDYQVLK